MEQAKLQAIRERVNKATPGPWEWRKGTGEVGRIVDVCHFGGGSNWDQWRGEEPDENDLDFILHAREDVPALLGEIERLRDTLREIAEYDVRSEMGFVDEWNEAGAFSICQQKARQTLAGESAGVDV